MANARVLGLFGAFLSSIVLTVAASPSSGSVAWNEATAGDLSDDTAAPTSLGSLAGGTHSIIIVAAPGDSDVVTFHIPDNSEFVGITASGYTGSDPSWLELAEGPIIPDRGIEFGNLLGYGHLDGSVTDVFALLRNGAGAHGFDPPLPPGDYSLLMGGGASYQLDLVVNNPEPGALTLLATVVLTATTTRRRATAGTP